MKEELLYKFVQGLTSPVESREVIQWAESSPENREKLMQEKELQDLLVWSLPAGKPELSLEDFLKEHAL
ncbi:MAG: hypothetical protein Q8914_01410 [Bacteroidota bacterium]|nr:hypothetical protein [Bacteroidota bacterium]